MSLTTYRADVYEVIDVVPQLGMVNALRRFGAFGMVPYVAGVVRQHRIVGVVDARHARPVSHSLFSPSGNGLYGTGARARRAFGERRSRAAEGGRHVLLLLPRVQALPSWFAGRIPCSFGVWVGSWRQRFFCPETLLAPQR